MIREAVASDLHGLLKLYLHLHETGVPEDSEALSAVWRQIMDDPNHHIIVDETDGQLVASCVCVVVPNLTPDRLEVGRRASILPEMRLSRWRQDGLRAMAPGTNIYRRPAQGIAACLRTGGEKAVRKRHPFLSL